MDDDLTVRETIRRDAEVLIRANRLFRTLASTFGSLDGRIASYESGLSNETVEEIIEQYEIAAGVSRLTMLRLGDFTQDDLERMAADLDRQDAALRLLATQA